MLFVPIDTQGVKCMEDGRQSELEGLATEIRKDVVRMTGVARSYGLASALAVVDIFVYLYWEYMKVYPKERNRRDRDRLVLSKGSAAPALYACLSRLGYFSREELWSYSRLGAMLHGYPDIRTPGVDAPGGAYGGGLGIASGICMALKMDNIDSKVFCVLGDGELQEGVVWESLFSAASRELSRLVLVVDANGHDESGSQIGLKNVEMLKVKLEAFGWFVCDADGHDFLSIERAFASFDCDDPRPKAVLAKTRAGRGVSFLQNDIDRASDLLSGDDIDHALSLLESRTRGEIS